LDGHSSSKAKVGKRKDFIKTEEVKVYPDTGWIKTLPTLIMSQCTMIILAQSIR
jgi:hypothetical protein